MPITHPDNKLNDLPGSKWLYLTQSVIKTNHPKTHGFLLRQQHGANKPPELMRDLITFFTKRGGSVLDPFAGVGGTLIGASLCGRRALGIEISPKWVSVYKAVCKTEGIRPQAIICGDCLNVMNRLVLARRKFSLILTDPPYNIRFDRTMCRGDYPNRNRQTQYSGFSGLQGDFSNCRTYEHYMDRMALFLDKGYRLLLRNRYLLVITKNAYQKGRYVLVDQDIAKMAESRGFVLKGEIVWYQNGVRLRPYGYPFTYVPNIVHHNILVLKKEARVGTTT